jgi:hypothetical protein
MSFFAQARRPAPGRQGCLADPSGAVAVCPHRGPCRRGGGHLGRGGARAQPRAAQASRRRATKMGSPVKASNGNAPVRGALVEDAGHAGRMTRAATWLVNVAIPKLIPDRLTGPLRERARCRRPAGARRPSACPSRGQARRGGSRRPHPMSSSTAESSGSDTALQATPEETVPYAGLMTRLIS